MILKTESFPGRLTAKEQINLCSSLEGESVWKERPYGERSFYSPVYNSSGEIVGALELLSGLKEKIDVSCSDMFVEQKEKAQ